MTSLACLQARQKDPLANCENLTLAASPTAALAGQLNAGNYPHYQDAACNSGGEYFCDPSGLLSAEERANVTSELRRLREESRVVCGDLLNDKVDQRHYQPFYLGVALAKGWPSSELDSESLQQFGRIVASAWNMDELYVGNPIPAARCPNTGLLIVLPDHSQAFLSSEACKFICQDSCGQDVASAVLGPMKSSGTAAGVLGGLREVYRQLQLRPTEVIGAAAPAAASGAIRLQASNAAAAEAVMDPDTWNTTQRVVFAVSVVVLLASLALGLSVVLLTPWLVAQRK